MTKNLDIISAAVSLIIKAALLAARFSGRVRKRSLKRLAAMDVDTKDKEIIFLRDKVDQLKMQVSILQKGINKRQKNLRYTMCLLSADWTRLSNIFSVNSLFF
jgi:hypothetical protein